MNERKYKTGVFKKFVLLFLTMIIPISVVAVLVYGWQIRTLKQNIIDNYKTVIHNNLNVVKSELTEMEQLSLEYLHDENILMLAGMGSVLSSYEKNAAMNRLFYHLELLRSNGNYVDNIYVYFPELERILDARENLYHYSLQEAERKTIQENKGNFYRNADKLYRFFSPQESSLSEERFNFVIILEYDEKKIEAALLENLKDSTLHIAAEKSIEEEVVNNKIWLYQIGKLQYGLSIQYAVPIAEIYPQMRSLQIYFLVFVFIFIGATILLIFKFYQLIKTPLGDLVKGFHQVEMGNLSTRLETKSKDEFGYLYESFNAMIGETQHLIEQVYEQENLVKTAKLKQLQSQINPHFLYNSFFVINNMARLQDAESIKHFSEYLAQYYQFIIQNEEEEITLLEEAEHCKVYCNIHQIRFGERISVLFGEVPDEYKDLMIPRLLLQPLVENAFEHGLKNKEEDGIIEISFIQNKTSLEIVVENNGELCEEKLKELQMIVKESDTATIKEETGSIWNTHRRLKLKYGDHSGLQMERGSMGGLRVSIVLTFSGTLITKEISEKCLNY